jgi:hypothetical protein
MSFFEQKPKSCVVLYACFGTCLAYVVVCENSPSKDTQCIMRKLASAGYMNANACVSVSVRHTEAHTRSYEMTMNRKPCIQEQRCWHRCIRYSHCSSACALCLDSPSPLRTCSCVWECECRCRSFDQSSLSHADRHHGESWQAVSYPPVYQFSGQICNTSFVRGWCTFLSCVDERSQSSPRQAVGNIWFAFLHSWSKKNNLHIPFTPQLNPIIKTAKVTFVPLSLIDRHTLVSALIWWCMEGRDYFRW